jgi:manganese/zinc/iron transport system substrate-binding protein
MVHSLRQDAFLHAWFCGIFSLAAASALTGCNSSTTADGHGHSSSPATIKPFAGEYPIKALCTTGMVADVVRQVGGDYLQVSQLMGAGVDPHLYKASTADIDQLAAADIIFYSGLHLEGKMGDVFVRMARRKPTFAITEGVPEQRVLEVGDGHFDPHLWFDVSLWSETIGVVEAALTQLDPPHAADYEQNAKRYRDELAALHEECKERIAAIPEERRVLVTAHDAFNYFGRAYDMQVRAIQGISTESEAGVKEINDLVSFITERKIKAVFVESSVSDRNIKALVEGCQAQGHEVRIGGELFSDAMGSPGTPEGAYVGMVRHNVETIVEALE